MNKRILLAFIVVFAVALSVGTIHASEVNVTDSSTAISQDDSTQISVDSSNQEVLESGVDNDSSNDVLESDISSTLSTNTEDSNILSSDYNASSNIDVSKTITSKDVTKYYKGSTKYTATFFDINGTPLANAKVKIKVDGKVYDKTTNSKGVASLDVNLKPGTYKVVATNPSTGYSLKTTFKILNTIQANDLTKVYMDGKKFSATFLKSNGKPLANKKVKFKINGKTYTKKTNSKGVASLSLTTLKKGTYKITSYNTDGLTKTKKVKVIKTSKTSLTSSEYTFLKSDSKTVKVKLLNQLGYAPTKGKVIKFTINGKKYTAKTNKDGVAKFKLPSLKVGKYSVKYKFDGDTYYKSSSSKNKVTIIPSKNPTFTVKSTKTFGEGAKTQFKLELTSGDVPLAGYKVTLKVNGSTYTKTTDSKGLVSLTIDLPIGNYTVSYTNKATSKVKSKTGSVDIVVKNRTASKIQWKSSTSFKQGTKTIKLQALDVNNKGISGETLKLKINSKEYSAKTDSSGYATFSFEIAPGDFNASYSYSGDNSNAPTSNYTSVHVDKVTKMSLKNIISSASSLKSYYESNKKLPNTVKCGGITFTLPEFLYMMSKAIYQLGNSNTKDVDVILGVAAPKSPSGDDIISRDLSKSNFITVAKNVANHISTNKQAPNYASSSLGKIIYSEVVDSFARILAFYGSNDRLPNYVTISYSSGGSSSTPSGQSGTGLNEKNTIKDLSAYLKSSKNCQVDNSKIKSLVNKVTKGLSTDIEKATAIFNYVRDTISYSFYYDTKYGAVGTANAGKGNCVDHSHLLVAMFRTADLPARYVHGTCKFSSGSTYGHVWSQVLVNGKWIVADATSSRNSFGKVVNWNTNSFSLNGIYISLSF